MADKQTDVKISMGVEINERQVEQEAKKASEVFKKNFDTGYVKLPTEITRHKYPKKTTTTKSGLTQGVDYSKLQKAQDELVSSWKKLSKQGFSSPDEDILNVLKAVRHYQNTAKKQYEGKPSAEAADKTLSELRRFFNTHLTRQFSRLLGDVALDIDSSQRGAFTRAKNDKLYERYAKEAIKKNKAAQAAGIDLSTDKPLTKKDRDTILEYEKKLEKDAKIEQVMEQKKYEQKHAKQIMRNEQKTIKKIEKERKKRSKKAIPIPKSDKPLEDVTLTSTEVKNLAEPKEDTRTYEEKKADKTSDRRTIKGFEGNATARKFNTPNNEIQLGYRQQMWNPTYLTKDLLYKMERGGTYVDTNALLRQTAAALPEEMKKAMESLVVRIDKDETARIFNEFSGTEKEQWNKEANKIGMSKLLLMNVAKVQGALMAGKKDTTADTLKDAITVALADAIRNGKSEIAAENYNKAITSITNMLMNRYSNMKDRLGSTVRRSNGEDEPDDPEIGVGRNYEEVKATLEEVFKEFQETSEQLLKVAIKQYPEYYGGKEDKKR